MWVQGKFCWTKFGPEKCWSNVFHSKTFCFQNDESKMNSVPKILSFKECLVLNNCVQTPFGSKQILVLKKFKAFESAKNLVQKQIWSKIKEVKGNVGVKQMLIHRKCWSNKNNQENF